MATLAPTPAEPEAVMSPPTPAPMQTMSYVDDPSSLPALGSHHSGGWT
eukprot:CAMPEP_0172402676 /NCGR_PEP_ID=MMETSP1061-20121228/55560_1 /TAXON_ID=37318 /ORGANISM="Pseudo-nitzschia pungens, Strain cf. pungens" /LENGTH=47 /DNA_ID= /DNA_START= /DNA_END= /DNA_ORIENTATION=